MKDSELLELAAKAAGYESFGISAVDGVSLCIDPAEYTPWNPLEDDGAALRLAMDCDLMIDCYDLCARPQHESIGWVDGGFGGDGYAYIRRAIVRAAAEIGRAMK